jgi:hypothetical protein
MKFHIYTQYLENYGDADKPYWKNKGGEDYIIEVPGFRYDTEFSEHHGQMIVDEISSKIEYRNDFSEEFIIGWAFVEDDITTQFEDQQLEYDGEVKYPARRMTIDELMETV